MLKIDFDRDKLTPREAQIVEAVARVGTALLLVIRPPGQLGGLTEAEAALVLCKLMAESLPDIRIRPGT